MNFYNILDESYTEAVNEVASKTEWHPIFKQDPNLKEYESLAKDIDTFLADNGTKNDEREAAKGRLLVYKINNIIFPSFSVFMAGAIFFKVICIPYLILAIVCSCINSKIQVAETVKCIDSTINDLKKVKSKSNDKKVKGRCDSEIKKLEGLLEKINNENV